MYLFAGIVSCPAADDTEGEMSPTAVCRIGVMMLALILLSAPAAAEPWSRARIERLPDSAFAVVELAPDGRKVRHLPHHDETGAVDPAHLRAARARFHQVNWMDPTSAEIARRHLDAHTVSGETSENGR